MSQSKKGSILEACMNILIGSGLSYMANMVIFHLYGWELSHSQNFQLLLIYTGISFVRSYTLRRIFNRIKL